MWPVFARFADAPFPNRSFIGVLRMAGERVGIEKKQLSPFGNYSLGGHEPTPNDFDGRRFRTIRPTSYCGRSSQGW
jgi:hypothetical protein